MDIMMGVPTTVNLEDTTKPIPIKAIKHMTKMAIKTSKSKLLSHDFNDITFNQDSNGVRRPKPIATIPAHQQYDI